MTKTWQRRTCVLAAMVLGTSTSLAIHPSSARAGTGAFAIDAQRYSIDGGRSVKSATAIGVLASPGYDASLALSRIDDSFDGVGYAAGIGGSVGLVPALSLRGGVTRVLRSTAPDAWSLRLGPEVHFGRTTLGANVFRSRRDDGVVTRGVSGDLEQALGARFATHVGGSLARTAGGADAQAGEVGARWQAVGPLHLLADVGLARDPSGVLSGGSGGGAGGGPIGGLGPGLGLGQDSKQAGTGNPNSARLTARFGVRIILP